MINSTNRLNKEHILQKLDWHYLASLKFRFRQIFLLYS